MQLVLAVYQPKFTEFWGMSRTLRICRTCPFIYSALISQDIRASVVKPPENRQFLGPTFYDVLGLWTSLSILAHVVRFC